MSLFVLAGVVVSCDDPPDGNADGGRPDLGLPADAAVSPDTAIREDGPPPPADIGPIVDLAHPTTAPWPTRRGDAAATGRSEARGPQKAPKRAWLFAAPEGFGDTPVVAADGTLYFSSTDGNLYALDANGMKKWVFPAKASVARSPAIGLDGTIYAVGDRLYALGPDGKQRWSFPIGSTLTSPNRAPGDGVYVCNGAGTLQRFDHDGALQWSFVAPHRPDMGVFLPSVSLAVAQDGTVYYGTEAGYLLAVDSAGRAPWEQRLGTPGAGVSAPAIGPDGSLLTESWFFTTLTSVLPNGMVKWSANIDNSGVAGRTSAAVALDGTVYVKSAFGLINAYAADGTPTWTWKLPGGAGFSNDPSPILDADGVVYIGDDKGFVHAVSSSGTLRWSVDTGASYLGTASMTADGTLLVTSSLGLLALR